MYTFQVKILSWVFFNEISCIHSCDVVVVIVVVVVFIVVVVIIVIVVVVIAKEY